MAHTFLFDPKPWIGEGTIILNMVEEELKFFTRWKISERDFLGKISSSQEIQIAGISENMKNDLFFFDFGSKTFSVEMENLNIGKLLGQGVYDEKVLAWEFRKNDLNFEGLAIYRKENDKSYSIYEEYVTADFRTLIKGMIRPEEGFSE